MLAAGSSASALDVAALDAEEAAELANKVSATVGLVVLADKLDASGIEYS